MPKRIILSGGTVQPYVDTLAMVVPSKVCGGYACFYAPGKTNEIKNDIAKLPIKDVLLYTKDTTPVLADKLDMSSLNANNIGFRLEALYETPEQFSDTFQLVKDAYKEDIETYTTYRSARVNNMDVYCIVIKLKHVCYVAMRTNPETGKLIPEKADTIVLTPQYYCTQDLFDRFISTGFSLQDYIQSMQQIKTSIDILHQTPNYFHGDIKYENMVFCGASVKLIDFPTDIHREPFPLTRLHDHNVFVHTWVFDSLRSPNAILTGQLYDRICFNMLIAMIVAPKQDVTTYQQLHYPDATQFIKQYQLSEANKEITQTAMEFIQWVPLRKKSLHAFPLSNTAIQQVERQTSVRTSLRAQRVPTMEINADIRPTLSKKNTPFEKKQDVPKRKWYQWKRRSTPLIKVV